MSNIVHRSVTLRCTAAEAFQKFTATEHLTGWLAKDAEVEPKAGGKYELFWDAGEREKNSTLGCRITAFEPDKLIAFDWKGPEPFRHFMNVARPLTHVTIFFLPSPETTEVHLIHTGWGDTPEWDDARQWFERAWSEALESLRNQIDEGR
ncbi:MAG TPA: SRPBCC domain-containing protein [Pyrinomonadaceae bacterium]|jgi:uncharacterized protein YndB with AHSA1/START domain